MFVYLVAAAAALRVPHVPQFSLQSVFAHGAAACPADLPFSCTNSTPIDNSCCFESPGGVFLQTQFWNYYPPIGGNETFTLHGLWPDNCDGTFEQFCDDSLNIKRGDLHRILVEQFRDQELYDKVELYWKNFNGNDEYLWVHEWNKHATCVKTIRPQCYGVNGKENRNVYDFFKTSVSLYEQLNTFDFLKGAGIVPSLDKTYSKEEVSAALEKAFGASVYFKCNKYSALQEIWYFHHLRGPLLLEKFAPIPALVESNCPDTGIKFLPKSKFSPPDGQKPNPGTRRGQVRLENHPGCLISNGNYYELGTCAKFTVADSPLGGYTVRSSKGVCGFSADGNFVCNRQNTVAKFQFQFDKKTRRIGYGGKFEWCLSDTGRHGSGRHIQIPLKLADGACESFQVKLAFD